MDRDQFYSWLGAVKPEHRGKGIAKKLLVSQEKWCRKQGYKAIQVKSMNQFKPMLLMLLSNILGFTEGRETTEHKIHFLKQLI